MCFYDIFLVILLLLFLALGVGAAYLQDSYLSEMKEQLNNVGGCNPASMPTSLKWVGDIDEAVNNSS